MLLPFLVQFLEQRIDARVRVAAVAGDLGNRESVVAHAKKSLPRSVERLEIKRVKLDPCERQAQCRQGLLESRMRNQPTNLSTPRRFNREHFVKPAFVAIPSRRKPRSFPVVVARLGG